MSSHVELGSATWTDVAAGPPPVLVVPVGSCEQHGPHLPMATDTLVARALAMGLADERPSVLVVPALSISASGEHAGFPGTLSIGTAAMTTVLVELVRSADWADGVVLVNGHGGNASAVSAAVSLLASEGRRVLAWWPRVDPAVFPRADAHAGWTETALLAYLHPALVRHGEAAAGDTRPLASVLPELRASGVAGVSANGVLGDPAGASAADGSALFEALVADLVARFDAWRV